ncbi:MAG: hypothetical protein MUO26_04620 [Methanotrichaceae archaeon]|nr:hypothetical protein [Methanotrichaceae archaeon]
MINKFTFVLAVSFILAALPVIGSAIENRPGEQAAEHLFNLGYGKPWVGGDPPWYQGNIEPLFLPLKRNVARGLHYYHIGTVQSNGYLTIGEGYGGMRIPYPPGSYQILRCYDENEKLVGIYIDLGGHYAPGWQYWY